MDPSQPKNKTDAAKEKIEWKQAPTVDESKEDTKSSSPENPVSQNSSKKVVSFSESTIGDPSDKNTKGDTVIAVENDLTERHEKAKGLESSHSEAQPLRDSMPSDRISKDEGHDNLTLIFMFLSWILIILTFPISIFSCFKMVQVSRFSFRLDAW